MKTLLLVLAILATGSADDATTAQWAAQYDALVGIREQAEAATKRDQPEVARALYVQMGALADAYLTQIEQTQKRGAWKDTFRIKTKDGMLSGLQFIAALKKCKGAAAAQQASAQAAAQKAQTAKAEQFKGQLAAQQAAVQKAQTAKAEQASAQLAAQQAAAQKAEAEQAKAQLAAQQRNAAPPSPAGASPKPLPAAQYARKLAEDRIEIEKAWQLLRLAKRSTGDPNGIPAAVLKYRGLVEAALAQIKVQQKAGLWRAQDKVRDHAGKMLSCKDHERALTDYSNSVLNRYEDALRDAKWRAEQSR